MSVLWFFGVRVSSAGGLVAKKSNRKSGAFDSCKLAVHPTVWRQSEDGKGGTPHSLISGWYPRGDSLSILLNDMGVDLSYFKRTLRQSQNMVG